MPGGKISPFPGPHPGGPNVGGSFPGRTIPEWMDTEGKGGKLIILKMEALVGELPKDPFIIRKSIDQHLQNTIDGAYPENKSSTYVLKVRSYKHAEELKKLNKLIDGTHIKISEHSTLNQAKCLVSNTYTMHMDEKTLQEKLKSQGVKEVRRFKKKVGNEFVNTATMVLTMDGTTIPEHILFGYERCQTRTYYPSPLMCYFCFEFGHTKGRCTNLEKGQVCGHCSGNHPSTPEQKCTKQQFCKRCNTDQHQLFNRNCPKYVDEDTIQHIRVDMDVSYPTAKAIFHKRSGQNSTANVVSQSMQTEMKQMKETMDAMKKTMQDNEKKHEERYSQYKKNLEKLKANNSELVKRNKQLEAEIQRISAQSEQRKHTAIQLRSALQTVSPKNAILKITTDITEMPPPDNPAKNTRNNKKRSRSQSQNTTPTQSDNDEMEYEAPLPQLDLTQGNLLEADEVIITDDADMIEEI